MTLEAAAAESEIPRVPGRAERGRNRLPNRRAVVAYWSFAYASFLLAMAVLILKPQSIAGFHYHPKMIAVVHLVTLGWVTCSIFGALHMVAPLALRSPVSPRKTDLWGFALVGVGIVGMAGHFWLDEPSGMAWAAGTLVVGMAIPIARFWRAIGRAKIPGEVKAHFYFSFFSLILAAGAGVAIAIHKSWPFLPGTNLSNVWAHAHLAALGWAAMMVFAAGYRLLPMFLPAAMPTGSWIWCSGVLLEVGTLGLAASLALESRSAVVFAAIVFAAFAVFIRNVRWMLANRRPASKHLRRPDYPTIQALVAIAYLIASAVLGLALLIGPPAGWKIGAALAYGVVFLVGFLAQIVVGISGRLLPLAAWLWRFADSDYQTPPPSPLRSTPRASQALVLMLWLAGVPALTYGLAVSSLTWIRAAGLLLATGIAINGYVLVATWKRLKSS